MTGVKQIETSVGKNETPAFTVHPVAHFGELVCGHDAGIGHPGRLSSAAPLRNICEARNILRMRIARIIDAAGRTRFATPTEQPARFEGLEGSWESGFLPDGTTIEAAQLLAPIEPAAVFAIGLNYRDHAAETGAPIPEYPVVFMKNPRSVVGPGGTIRLPRRLRSDEVDCEAELAIVLSRDCRNASRDSAMDFVAGFTCANDVSARDWQLQRSGRQWCRAKSFDTFCPLGPWVVTPDELPDPLHLEIASRINGRILQSSNTRQMIFDVPALLEFLSADTTLPAGSVILTGTPHGVGMARKPPVWLQPGDKVEIEIAGIGHLENPVAEDDG